MNDATIYAALLIFVPFIMLVMIDKGVFKRRKKIQWTLAEVNDEMAFYEALMRNAAAQLDVIPHDDQAEINRLVGNLQYSYQAYQALVELRRIVIGELPPPEGYTL